MKRRIIAFLLLFTLSVPLAVPALAAGDVVWSKDTTLTKFGYDCDNAVVKAGVTVKFQNWKPDPQAIFVHKSLTVEPGGSITGGGTIGFIGSGASYSGIDLYYKVQGREVLLDPANLADLIAQDPENRSIFWWESDTKHFVLHGYDFNVDPFAPPAPGDNFPVQQDYTRETQIADRLRSLGLFLGTSERADGSAVYELERLPTRVEAVVMLIRLKGRAEEAKAYPAERCPFDDVDEWARPYLAYAYDTGLTMGVGGGKFGAGDATPQQFITFVLRAMGYSDGADFAWDHSEELAMSLGILAGDADIYGFSRGACVRIMDAALRNAMKDGTEFWRKLAADGVFTEEEYLEAMS